MVIVKTTVRRDVLTLPAAPLGPENPLPPLRLLREAHRLDERAKDGLPRDMVRQLGYEPLRSVLPVRVLDGYGRERAETGTRHPRHRERPAARHRPARVRRPGPLPAAQADRPRTAPPQPGPAARRVRAERRLDRRRHRVEHRRHRAHHPLLRPRARGPGDRARRRRDAAPVGVGAAARPALPGGPLAPGGLRLPARRSARPQPAREARARLLVVEHRGARGAQGARPGRRGVAVHLRGRAAQGAAPGGGGRRPDVSRAR
ncbi:hypothetical protein SALBM135S_06348 [Streptomyces alboniger]